jgi:hypothetical protein
MPLLQRIEGFSPPVRIASGREQGEEFIIEWQDKEGTKKDIKLEKYEDDVVKAKLTREGPVIKAGYRPYLEAYLKTKIISRGFSMPVAFRYGRI